MPSPALAFVVDRRDAFAHASYCASVLGHKVFERNTGEHEVSGQASAGTPLYFMNVPEPKTVKNRLHVEITTEGPWSKRYTDQ